MIRLASSLAALAIGAVIARDIHSAAEALRVAVATLGGAGGR